jgi:hypothetical protein
VDNVSTTSEIRNDALRPMVSAITPVGISKIVVPADQAALAMKTSLTVRPASRRNRVFTPQMRDEASV